MLALTRKPGQQIMIGEDIVINFVDVQGDSVRVAIDAPKHIKIYRGELYAAIIAENKRAMESSTEKIELPHINKK
ncbi:MAG: carbon storage regulator [Firmicutes bacterium]|nr:carbon storage regulator [Bacillota bacterium]